jgi:hypothetical protein
LPLKASVRKKEDILAGESVTFTITLRWNYWHQRRTGVWLA